MEGVKELDDDPQCQVVRAARTDQRSRQLEVGFRVDEHPGVLVRVSEGSELLVPPAHDSLVLEGQLVRWWVLRRRHTS